VSGPARRALLLTGLYLLVAGALAAHHEMWRDELRAWSLVRQTGDLATLVRALAWEGHPPLWYLLLTPLVRLGMPPWSMQALNLVLAAGAVFVLARWAPFSWPVKALLAAGYYFLYEYAVVCRSYALGMLLFFGAAALFPRRRERAVTLGALLFLAAWTSAVAAVLALAVAVAVLVEAAVAPPPARAGEGRAATVSAALAVAGALTAAVIAWPAPDLGLAAEWYTGWDVDRVTRVSARLATGLLPVQLLNPDSWNSSAHPEPVPGWPLPAALLPVLAVGAALPLARRPAAFALFASATAGLLTLFYVKYHGFSWHYGHWLLALVLAAWIAPGASGRPLAAWARRAARAGALALLVLQLPVTLVAAGREVARPFSCGLAAARYIERTGLADRLIVGEQADAVSTVAGYLGRPVYYPRERRFRLVPTWDASWRAASHPEAVVANALRLAPPAGGQVLLVLNEPLGRNRRRNLGLVERARFTGAIVNDEDFFLYEAAPP
jgi:hypothetical protein